MPVAEKAVAQIRGHPRMVCVSQSDSQCVDRGFLEGVDREMMRVSPDHTPDGLPPGAAHAMPLGRVFTENAGDRMTSRHRKPLFGGHGQTGASRDGHRDAPYP